MGESHQNVLEILEVVDLYTENGDPFFTVSDIHEDMLMSEYEYDMSERSVRRILKEIHHHGLLEHREVGNQKVYVVENEDMIPSFHQLHQ